MSDNLTYEEKVEQLNAILHGLDNSETPIDKLAADVKKGAQIIKDLTGTLRNVETVIKDAFKELEASNL